jgi:outer membrane receptor for monomeric catechols
MAQVSLMVQLPATSVSNSYNNPDLKPEKNLERELGLELGFLKDRITFRAAAYKSNSKNQTIPMVFHGRQDLAALMLTPAKCKTRGLS